jgi:NTE family protein
MFNAIVLSGGGIKGFGTLGGIQYLLDNNLLPDLKYYSGTSIGSIICYFLAIGYTPIEMIIYIISNKVFDIPDANIDSFIKGEGIYNFSIFYKHFEQMTLDKLNYIPTLKELYEKLGKILYTCTFNITSKKKEYISYHTHPDMLCIDAIRLSASLPFIFNDCIYKEEYFIDGGFVDNCPFLPITLLNENENLNIVIFNLKNENKDEYYKMIDKFYTIIMIPMNELLELQLKSIKENCTIINLEMESIKLYHFHITHSKKLELFSVGYNLTKSIIIK